MDTPLFALDQMGVKFVHKFSADTCPADDKEQLDLFVAGIPCQPFSQCGQAEGFDDKANGDVFFKVLNEVYQ